MPYTAYFYVQTLSYKTNKIFVAQEIDEGLRLTILNACTVYNSLIWDFADDSRIILFLINSGLTVFS